MFYDYESGYNAPVQFTEENIRGGEKRKRAASTKTLSEDDLEKIKQYISDNIAEHITVSDLAQVVGVSKFHFVRVFKTLTGYTPYQYLLSQRVLYSKRLLENEDISISSVAYRSGFSNQSHFTTVFKRAIGMTPKRYKDSIKKN